MVDSELGEIPGGWQIKEIKDCGEVICGKTPPTVDKENYGDNIFFITIPDMRGQAFVIKTERKLSKRGASLQKNKELPPLAICVSCIATPGLVSITSDISHTNQQINSIICKKDISPYFMYYTMLNKSEEIKTMGLGGTATLNLNTGNFARIKVIIPDHITMDAFHKKVTPIMSRLLSNLQENIELCNIRDSLLPKLMSGKIRVVI
jgi:type I restriction enzyme S subunit